jgi:hypothetical protein
MSFVLEMSIKDEHDLFCHNSKMYYDYVESIVDYEHFEVILCLMAKNCDDYTPTILQLHDN